MGRNRINNFNSGQGHLVQEIVDVGYKYTHHFTSLGRFKNPERGILGRGRKNLTLCPHESVERGRAQISPLPLWDQGQSWSDF